MKNIRGSQRSGGSKDGKQKRKIAMQKLRVESNEVCVNTREKKREELS